MCLLRLLPAVPNQNGNDYEDKSEDDSQLYRHPFLGRAFGAGLELFVVAKLANTTDRAFVARFTWVYKGGDTPLARLFPWAFGGFWHGVCEVPEGVVIRRYRIQKIVGEILIAFFVCLVLPFPPVTGS